MKMNQGTLLFLTLAYAGGLAIARSADQPEVQAGQQSHYSDPVNGNREHSLGQGSPMAQLPPTGWTDLSGKVQSFDRTSKTLQLRDKHGNLYLVPMDNQVTILRNGKGVSFSRIHPGDTVRLHMTRS